MPFVFAKGSSSVSADDKKTNMDFNFRLFIVSLACLCCLTPPALGSLHVLKAAAAVGAVKGAALLGAGALAIKGAAIKGAVKGAVAKGAAIIAAKKAAVKGALALAAKAADIAVHKLPAVVPPPVVLQPAPIPFAIPVTNTIIRTTPSLPPVLSSLSSLWSAAHSAVQHKLNAVGGAIETLHPQRVIAAPFVYEIPEPARFYPLLQRVEQDCL